MNFTWFTPDTVRAQTDAPSLTMHPTDGRLSFNRAATAAFGLEAVDYVRLGYDLTARVGAIELLKAEVKDAVKVCHTKNNTADVTRRGFFIAAEIAKNPTRKALLRRDGDMLLFGLDDDKAVAETSQSATEPVTANATQAGAPAPPTEAVNAKPAEPADAPQSQVGPVRPNMALSPWCEPNFMSVLRDGIADAPRCHTSTFGVTRIGNSRNGPKYAVRLRGFRDDADLTAIVTNSPTLGWVAQATGDDALYAVSAK